MQSNNVTTNDGRKLIVFFNSINYEYSIDNIKIDPSSLIKSVSEIYDKIIIDFSKCEAYIKANECEESFIELYNFIKSIFDIYNTTIDEVEEELENS